MCSEAKSGRTDNAISIDRVKKAIEVKKDISNPDKFKQPNDH